MPSDRKLTGKYAIRGLGANDLTWKANAYGTGTGDRRKVAARVLGLPTAPRPKLLAGEAADAADMDIDLASLKLTRAKLTRGKLAAMSRAMAGGVKTGTEHVPITVQGDTVIDGNHRVAAMLLDGKKGKVKVKLLGQRQETKKAMKMPTKAAMQAMSEADLKALDKEMHDAGEESSAAHSTLAEVCVEKDCAMPCGMGKAGAVKPTEEQVGLGVNAARQAAGGKNPPTWAVDETVWSKAKRAAAKTYEESDDAYWPAVVALYEQMGGTVKTKKLSKADLGPSLWDVERKVAEAVRKKYGANTSLRGIYPESDTVIVELFPPWDGMQGMVTQTDKTRYYWAEYELADDGTVTLGDWEEVEESREWAPVAKAIGDLSMVKTSRIASLLAAALVRAKVAPDELSYQLGVSQATLTGLLSGVVVHLGTHESKPLATYLGLTEDALQAMIGEVALAGAERPEVTSPAGADTLTKAVEYRARHIGAGEFLVEGLNGDRDELVKALNRAGGMSAEVLADPTRARVRVDRYSRESPPLGAELLIKADVRYEPEESESRELAFLGAPAELRKAAELGVLYAVAYAPGDESTPDLQGEWTDAEEIRKAAHAYLTNHRVIKRQHEGKATDDQVVESYIAPQDLTINGTLVKSGSWVVGIKLGAESKKLVKAGKMRGVSIGGTKKVVA